MAHRCGPQQADNDNAVPSMRRQHHRWHSVVVSGERSDNNGGPWVRFRWSEGPRTGLARAPGALRGSRVQGIVATVPPRSAPGVWRRGAAGRTGCRECRECRGRRRPGAAEAGKAGGPVPPDRLPGVVHAGRVADRPRPRNPGIPGIRPPRPRGGGTLPSRKPRQSAPASPAKPARTRLTLTETHPWAIDAALAPFAARFVLGGLLGCRD